MAPLPHITQYLVILTVFQLRYLIEALDRTLGNDWHQVGEATPGDRKVGVTVIVTVADMSRVTLADEDTAFRASA